MSSAPIHDDEPDISEPVVRSLLRAQCPAWAQGQFVYYVPKRHSLGDVMTHTLEQILEAR